MRPFATRDLRRVLSICRQVQAQAQAQAQAQEVSYLGASGWQAQAQVKARDMRELVGGGGEGGEVSAVVVEELASAQGAVR